MRTVVQAPSLSSRLLCGAAVVGALGASACAGVLPVEIQPAPAALKAKRVLLPAEILLTGPRVDAALSVDPDLGQNLRRRLSDSLRAAGYEPSDGPAQPGDLRLEATVAVTQVSRAVVTGTYVNMSGRVRIFGGERALDLVRAASHPDDARFYPDLELASTRLVDQLVNGIGVSERVLAFAAGAPLGAEASDRPSAPADAESGGEAPSTAPAAAPNPPAPGE